MDISVIVATYKRNNLLKRTLDSYINLNIRNISWEIIIVDNYVDEETKKLVESYQDRLPIQYYFEKQKGKNHALNFSVSIAKGELFIMSDDDVIVDKDWIMNMYEGSKRWKDCSVFGGRILPFWPKNEWSFYKDLPEDFSSMAFAIADWDIKEGPYNAGKVWGPNMAYRRNIFDEGRRFNVLVGPKGKDYIMGSETEFTKSLELEGFTPVYIPAAIVYHQIRESQLTRKWLVQRAFIFGRTDVYYEKQNLSAKLFRAPRYLYRMLIKHEIYKIFYLLTNNFKSLLCESIQCGMIKGRIFQYRKNYRTGHKPENSIKVRNLSNALQNDNPKVSVIIPTFNRSEYLCEAIESVLQQTYKNFEVIVVDDGSTDDTEKILNKKYGDKIIIYKQDNRGNPAARNLGIRYAQGDYIAFLDDDDLWMPNKLEEVIRYFKRNPNIDFVYSGSNYIDQAGKFISKHMHWNNEQTNFDSLFQHNQIISSSLVTVRKKCLLEVGGFDEELLQSSDYDLWLRMAKKFQFGLVEKILVNYRLHDNNISANWDRRLKYHLRIFSKKDIISGLRRLEVQKRKANSFYYIAGEFSKQAQYLQSSRKYARAILIYPLIGLAHWPKEVKNMRFTFLYRFIRPYCLVLYYFLISIIRAKE